MIISFILFELDRKTFIYEVHRSGTSLETMGHWSSVGLIWMPNIGPPHTDDSLLILRSLMGQIRLSRDNWKLKIWIDIEIHQVDLSLRHSGESSQVNWVLMGLAIWSSLQQINLVLIKLSFLVELQAVILVEITYSTWVFTMINAYCCLNCLI